MANGPRLRQVPFGYFCLICYYVCAEMTTDVLGINLLQLFGAITQQIFTVGVDQY